MSNDEESKLLPAAKDRLGRAREWAAFECGASPIVGYPAVASSEESLLSSFTTCQLADRETGHLSLSLMNLAE